MSLHFLEKCQIVSGFVPVNLATAVNTGDYVSLKNYGRCAVVFFAAAGTAGDDPTITLTQAQDVSGTGVIQKIWVIDAQAEDLDIANGFDCLKAEVSDAGANSQIGGLLYILHEPRFASDPLPSAIAN